MKHICRPRSIHRLPIPKFYLELPLHRGEVLAAQGIFNTCLGTKAAAKTSAKGLLRPLGDRKSSRAEEVQGSGAPLPRPHASHTSKACIHRQS